jgi:hypothetical protein
MSSNLSHSESNLFDAYKSIGHVTEAIPFSYTMGALTRDSRVYTSIGNTFHSYLVCHSLLYVCTHLSNTSYIR